jgi:hypothetical protein
MLIPLIVALQLQAAAPAWKVIDRTTIAWRAGATPYEVLIEERAAPTPDADTMARVRVRVPGRKDFIVVDDRGPGPYVPAREALRYANHALIPPTLRDSVRVLVLPLRGTGSTTVFALFGYAYASDPGELTLVGFDATGYPRLLFQKEFDLTDVTDLDGDGTPEIVGRPSVPQAFSQCSATYDPYAVYRLSKGEPRYDLALSRRYNEKHYVWAGAKASEEIEVDHCTPGKYRAVRHKP